MKRLVSLDAMRGVAILGMIISHALIFGPFYPIQSLAEGVPTHDVLIPQSPLEMSPPYFFFVSGISLTVSLYIRQKTRGQSLKQITKHILIRNSVLILIGTLITPLLMDDTTHQFLVFNNVAHNISVSFGYDVIQMLGWAGILAFPLALFFSWEVLLALSSVLFVLVSFILSYQIYTNIPILTALLITGNFSLLKTFPFVLLGGAIGKKLLDRKRSYAKWSAAIGIVAFIGFLVVLEYFGGGIGFGGGRKLYWFASAMTIGFCFMALGLFAFLENRGYKLFPITVIGRLALKVYIIHEIILLMLYMLIPHYPNLILSIIYGLSVSVIVWAGAYLYSKHKWGNLADQYEPPPKLQLP